ncbi:MAG: mechanosensitive ion channel [Actinomycetales bacterium]|nr:mechanosensitive ion channel [Actinomycetales bacterium]
MDELLTNASDFFDTFSWVVVARILIVLIIAIVAQIVGSHAIRRLAKTFAERAPKIRPSSLRGADSAEMTQALLNDRQQQRANSLGSLARSALTLTIWTITVMTILTIVGVNVGPLLASAGVLGVVLGFGAQTLVADYLAGVSMIFEDQLGIGDIVDLGVVMGEVEQVALRYTRVRDTFGVVWYVRNGTIQYVANQSQGWTFALVDIPVPTEQDITKVADVITRAGREIGQDPEFRDLLLGDPFYSGVVSVTATTTVVRVNTKIVPSTSEAGTTRMLRQRLVQALQNEGIRIPYDGVQIQTIHATAAVRHEPPGADRPSGPAQ